MTGLTAATAARPAKFRPNCPKCGSKYSYEITRLNSGTYKDERSSEWLDRVFSCMCGKQLFGDAIRIEFDRQYDATIAEEELAAEAARRQRQEEEVRRRLAEARLAEETQRKVLEEEARALQIAGRGGLCAWAECNHKARPTSIYCSRECNNKNARARHKQRKTS